MIEDSSAYVKGINLLFSGKLSECDAYFEEIIKQMDKQDNSDLAFKCKKIRNAIGLSFVSIARAFISFDHAEREEALKRLGESQRLVAGIRSKTGYLSYFSSSQNKQPSPPAIISPQDTLLLNLDFDLAEAETSLFSAMLHFIQEEKSFTSIIRGAYLVRKSYKIYEKVHEDLRKNGLLLLESIDNNNNFTSTNAVLNEGEVFYDSYPPELFASQDVASEGYGALIKRNKTIQEAVNSACELGLGTFHLIFSLIPTRILSYLAKFGFGEVSKANREVGLNMLKHAAFLKTSRSPIAIVVLLSFHSAVLISAHGLMIGDSKTLDSCLNLALMQYPESPLFRFFQGRFFRSLGRLPLACDIYRIVEVQAKHIKPLKHLCTYERAFIEMISGRYQEAGDSFAEIARESVLFSPAFYGFLSGISYFELGARKILKENATPHELTMGRRAIKKALVMFFHVLEAIKARKRSIPPEAYSKRKSQTVLRWFHSVYHKSSESDFDLVLKNGEEDAVLLRRFITGSVFCPCEEICYLWNGLFQLTTDQKLRNLMILESLKKQYLLSGDGERNNRRFIYVFHLLEAAYLRELDRTDEAQTSLKLILTGIPLETAPTPQAEGEHSLTWIREHALYEGGLCLLKQNKRQEALAQFSKVGDPAFEFDARFRFRVRSAIGSLSM